jgi:hypothetical protein
MPSQIAHDHLEALAGLAADAEFFAQHRRRDKFRLSTSQRNLLNRFAVCRTSYKLRE